jgi:hypothetical protein
MEQWIKRSMVIENKSKNRYLFSNEKGTKELIRPFRESMIL